MIDQKYEQLHRMPSDINEHFPTIKKYASEADYIVELGVRGIVSTWALLAGKPKQMLSVDIEHPSTFGGDIFEVLDAAYQENIIWDFAQRSSLEMEIPECDLLFIDTLHEKDQLSQELKLHSNKAKKYILMHDTNKEEFPGMNQALDEFLEQNKEWEVAERTEDCHGLTILKRV